jgi:uridine kinase
MSTSPESVSPEGTPRASQPGEEGWHSIPVNKHQWSVGRAPWYQDAPKPFIIGVTGGSASGKTSVCEAIVSALSLPWVGLLSMDRYYKVLSQDEIDVCKKGLYNFDHPDAFDVDQLYEDIVQLRQGKAVDVPVYDFVTHSRSPQCDRMYGVDIVIVEGILLFYNPKIRELLDLKIYVDTDNDLRLSRRIKRDIVERGRSVENVLDQYQRTVKPSFEQFIQPTKRFADLIVPWNDTNQAAIELLTQHIASKLYERQNVRVNLPPGFKVTLPQKLPIPTPYLRPTNTSVLIHSPSLAAAAPSSPNTGPDSFSLDGNNTTTTTATSATTGGAKETKLVPSSRRLSTSSLNTTASGSATSSPIYPRDKYAGFGTPLPNYEFELLDPPSNPLVESINAAENYKTVYVDYLRGLHQERHNALIRPKTRLPHTTMVFPKNVPNNLLILPPTKSMVAIHTTLRDKKTQIDDFRFVLCRLVRILASEAMNLVTFRPTTVVTPTGEEFHGLQCRPDQMVAVSIVRAGEAFEHPVRDVIKDISLGKIVIQHQTDKSTGPRLYYARLPPVKKSKILLFDGVLSTGAAVIMAVHVLLDHGVLAEDIIFCCLAAAPEGIYALTSMFPQVTIITSALEQGIDEYLHAVPGVAFVADRYFGTMGSALKNHTELIKRSEEKKAKNLSSNENTQNVTSIPQDSKDDKHFVSIDNHDVEVIPLDSP